MPKLNIQEVTRHLAEAEDSAVEEALQQEQDLDNDEMDAIMYEEYWDDLELDMLDKEDRFSEEHDDGWRGYDWEYDDLDW